MKTIIRLAILTTTLAAAALLSGCVIYVRSDKADKAAPAQTVSTNAAPVAAK